MCLPPLHKESEVENLPVFNSHLNILVSLYGNNLDHIQDYNGKDGMM